MVESSSNVYYKVTAPTSQQSAQSPRLEQSVGGFANQSHKSLGTGSHAEHVIGEPNGRTALLTAQSTRNKQKSYNHRGRELIKAGQSGNGTKGPRVNHKF